MIVLRINTQTLMRYTRNITSLLLLSVFLFAGCAGTKKAAEEMVKAPHPLTGVWNYSLDTPQGVYTGVMTFAELESMLTGTITSDDQPDQTAALEDLSFDNEMSKLKFKFDGGEFGTLSVNSTMEGDKMNGTMTIGAYGVDVALTASRKMP